MSSVEIKGKKVPVKQANTLRTPQDAARRVAEEMPAFARWLGRMREQADLSVEEIIVDAVDMPPVPPSHASLAGVRPGFAAMRVSAMCVRSGVKIPPLVLLRGQACSVLVVLRAGEEEFALLTVAPRFAVGHSDLAEVPCGSFDPAGNFVGQAAQELKEEGRLTGLHKADMLRLGPARDESGPEGLYSAPHATDERVEVYLWKKEVLPEYIQSSRKRLNGKRSDGDMMTLLLAPVNEAWKETPDARSLAALSLYENLRSQGTCPDQTIRKR
eukprot:Hpha_TRINITY_DN4119_c0_g1::TRINITY_DN4119_c0_g1_i2::g.194641::m.194641/K18447/NUDX14; ADP-sugar diphosphatase